MRRKITSLTLFFLLVMLGTAYAQGPEHGTDGIGDPYFPLLGNGGYDVQHYTIQLDVDIANNTLEGVTTIEADPLASLRTFNLDFEGFTLGEVRLNDTDVDWDRESGELVIVPPVPVPDGEPFTVSVAYSGTPGIAMSAAIPVPLGWQNFGGGVFVASEPSGAAAWYPVNNHPQDKATYTFDITVPQPYVVAANGTLQEEIDNGDGTTTFIWESRDPIASYLVSVCIDEFVIQTDEGPDGLPIRNYFPPDIAEAAAQVFAPTADMITYFSEIFGPYPFEAYGVVVADTDLGFALENQTLTLFARNWVELDAQAIEETVAHELAHQWYGDSISPETWDQIWLNEGFATYAQWLWLEHRYGPEAAEQAIVRAYQAIALDTQSFNVTASKDEVLGVMVGLPLDEITLNYDEVSTFVRILLAGSQTEDEIAALLDQIPTSDITGDQLVLFVGTLPFESVQLSGEAIGTINSLLGLENERYQLPQSNFVPPGAAPPDDLFNRSVYWRGGLTLHALRLAVGDEAFFDILRTYSERFQYSTATTTDFTALAEEVSGQELDDLFGAWLYDPVMPGIPEMGLSVTG